MFDTSLIRDIGASFRGARTWLLLGWDDIERRYKRSKLGPLWLTCGLAAMTIGIGVLFSQILKTPMNDYMHFLAAGLAVWLFISMTLSEACDTFQSSAGIIKNYKLPKTSLVLRVVWRNVIAFGHYMLFFVVLLFVLQAEFSWVMLMAIPGLILLAIALFQGALILAFCAARFRDISQMVIYLLQAIFFVTPIMWEIGAIKRGVKFITMNPFHHMISVVRDPLVGNMWSMDNLIGIGLIIALQTLILIPLYKWGNARVIHWV